LIRTLMLFAGLGLICDSAALAQAVAGKAPAPPTQPASDLAKGLSQRLSDQLHAKTVVGEPIQAGSVTLIPILLVDVNFAGGSVAAPAPNAPAADGFLMSGEARPLGFVAITAKGTRFIPVAGTPAK
jgi:uncharacterized spore protein YtfJ